MAARKRIVKKLPEFKSPGAQQEQKEEDLKKVKAQTLTELDKDDKDWYDKELEKNLKKSAGS